MLLLAVMSLNGQPSLVKFSLLPSHLPASLMPRKAGKAERPAAKFLSLSSSFYDTEHDSLPLHRLMRNGVFSIEWECSEVVRIRNRGMQVNNLKPE